MDDAARDRMALDLADERGLALAAAVGQRDDRVAPGAVHQVFEGARVERECSGDDAVPVEHRRNLAGRAQRVRSGRAELRAPLDGEVESLLATASFYKRSR